MQPAGIPAVSMNDVPEDILSRTARRSHMRSMMVRVCAGMVLAVAGVMATFGQAAAGGGAAAREEAKPVQAKAGESKGSQAAGGGRAGETRPEQASSPGETKRERPSVTTDATGRG